MTSSADNGGLYVVDLETGASQCLLANGTGELKRAHGICTRKDGTLVITERTRRSRFTTSKYRK